MSVENYDSTLIGWQAKPHKSDILLGAHGLEYCAADSARKELLADGWVIRGDSLVNSCITSLSEYTNSTFLFKLYPNPTNGLLNISLEGEAQEEFISIYDSRAKLLREIKLQNGVTKTDLSEYPNGFYFIKIGSQFKKLILLK